MPWRRTAPLPSQIPVGQPPCKHKFDGTIYRSRSHTLHPCFQFYRYFTSMTPFHTHCICYVFLFEISSTHCLCFAQTISHTHPRTYLHLKKKCTQDACTHISFPATPAQVHGGVRFCTKRQPMWKFDACSGCLLEGGSGTMPRRNKVRLYALVLNNFIYSSMARTK